MSSFDFELWIEQYKYQMKKARAERPLSADEVNFLTNNLKDMPKEYEEAYNHAVSGDYGMFEKLPYLLRNYLGALEMQKLREQFGRVPSLENEELRKYLEKNAMNAALRAGISAEKNGNSMRATAKALDSYMNRVLMKRTMMPPTQEGRTQVVSRYGEDRANTEIQKNRERQAVLAKAMLLAQIGKYDVVSKNGLSGELEAPVYETLVHGSRTNFVLPVGENSQAVLDSFMGAHSGEAAGIVKRTAATHSVKRRKLDKNGVLSSAGKEERTYSPLKVFSHQFGMDLAVGGMGELGPDQKIICGTGESGHLYMRAQKGDAKHCGSLLIGIEGSAPGGDSFLGNEHGITAKSAKQSAFLADKSIVGKKVGGRQVDLSGVNVADLSELLTTFSERYAALQNDANTEDGRKRLEAVNDMLMGNHMTREAFSEMLGMLGMATEKNNSLFAQARNGYLNRTKAGEISKDQFEQSIRKGFSQEKACAIAEERFEASEDLAHCVGAVKELMLTHETRGLVWKLRHPIQNYRENATIDSLTKRLVSDKHFTRAQIADEFLSDSDSFAMDWGKALSNDRDAIRFARENRQSFKPAEPMMLGVLKANYSDQIKDATPKNERDLKMKSELQKVFNERASKEKIVIHEESELNKSVQKTAAPVTSQKNRESSKNL